EHAWYNAVSEGTKTRRTTPVGAYLNWRDSAIVKIQDPIWLSAHAVIALFLLTYAAIGLHKADTLHKYPDWSIILGVVATPIILGCLIWWSLAHHSIRD